MASEDEAMLAKINELAGELATRHLFVRTTNDIDAGKINRHKTEQLSEYQPEQGFNSYRGTDTCTPQSPHVTNLS